MYRPFQHTKAKPLTIRVLSLLVVLACVDCQSLQARGLPDHRYELMFKQADLVVIGRSRGTKDVKTDDAFGVDKPYVSQVETTFDVEGILKGKLEEKTFTLVHFRPSDAKGKLPGNGPLLAKFESEGPPAGRELLTFRQLRQKPPEYLLFLKKREDGTYGAVCGQMDSALSVRKLNKVY